MTTWRKEFNELFKTTGDKMEDLTFDLAFDIKNLDRKFDGGFGYTDGDPFIAWSKNHVYFSREFDGADYIDYVPRNPTVELKEMTK